MSRSVLTDADGIVGEDEDDRQLHQRREADRRLHIIRENQIARTERPELREGKAVADGAHRMLAYAEMKVASSIGVGLEITRPVQLRARFEHGSASGRERGCQYV